MMMISRRNYGSCEWSEFFLGEDNSLWPTEGNFDNKSSQETATRPNISFILNGVPLFMLNVFIYEQE